MTTIKDVARALNLSITTVSRALDGYTDVAPHTRVLVLQKAVEMGYTPNRAARQLRRRQSDTLGYIMPTETPQFADAFFSEFIAGLGDVAAAHNYDLLVSAASPDSPMEKAIYQRWVQGCKVDGLILNRVRLCDWRVEYLYGQKFPFVSMERSQLPVEYIGVETETRQSLGELIEHLVNQGHSRIAYIGGAQTLKIDYDRQQAYEAGLRQMHINPDSALTMRADLTSAGGYRAAGALLALANPPTALVCINDLTAIGAMHAVHDLGLKVGRDIAVAGFDGVADSAHTQPPLTTIDQPVYAIAGTLVEMLLGVIHKRSLLERQIQIKPNLLIRASTGY